MKKIVFVPFFTALLILLSRESSAAHTVGWLTEREFNLVFWVLVAALFVSILITIVLIIRCPRQEQEEGHD